MPHLLGLSLSMKPGKIDFFYFSFKVQTKIAKYYGVEKLNIDEECFTQTGNRRTPTMEMSEQEEKNDRKQKL